MSSAGELQAGRGRDAGDDRLPAPGRLERRAELRPAVRVDRPRPADDRHVGEQLAQLGQELAVGAEVAARGQDRREAERPRGPREPDDRVLELDGALVADPLGQADLVVDQQQDGVVGGQGACEAGCGRRG
jgi:hypothetical protein